MTKGGPKGGTKSVAWHAIAGPRGGGVSGLATLPNGRLFAAVNGDHACDGEVAIFSQASQGWLQTAAFARFLDVLGFVARGRELFAATGQGVLRSADSGETWAAHNTGLTMTNVQALAVDGKGGVFAGTYGAGVFRLDDTGVWRARPGTPLFVTALSCAGDVVLALAEGQLLRAIDGGVWQSLSTGGRSGSPDACAIEGPRMAALLGESLLLSVNSGKTWQRFTRPSGAACLAFCDDVLYLGGNKGLARVDTKSGVATPITPDTNDANISALHVPAQPGSDARRLVAGSKDGRVLALVRDTVTTLSDGLLELRAIKQAFADETGALCVRSAAGLYVLTEASVAEAATDWRRVGGPVDALCRGGDGHLWCATAAGVARFDGDRFVIQVALPEIAAADFRLHAQAVSALGVSRTGELWLCVTQSGMSSYPETPSSRMPIMHVAARQSTPVYRWRNGSWTHVCDNNVTAFAFGEDGQVFLAGASGLFVLRGETLARLLDRGCNDVVIDGDKRLVVATTGSAFVSETTDTIALESVATSYAERGSWGSIQGNVGEVVAMTVDGAGAVWGATRGSDGGAFRLSGRKWQSINFGLTLQENVGSRSVFPACIAVLKDGTAFVGTENLGLFRRARSES